VTDVPPWNPDEGGPSYTYARLADHLAARIRSGELAPGTMLPGERALSEQYSVALGTIRRALDVLRERGMITTLPHKGTFVTGPG
jgi:DNA-binding GntR family transcriptional regulator